jgi:prepilin-type N-terminal cleavage/methylation domain-containing protein
MIPKIKNQKSRGFTLVELLVVISIIGLLAGMVFVAGGVVKTKSKISTARGELEIIRSALDAYHAKYNAYPPSNPGLAMTNQLYYELSGVAFNSGTATFTTLDGAANLSQANFSSVFNAAGVLNSTKNSGGEDGASAKKFLSGLSSKMIGTFGSANVLVTSVGGSDERYLAALSAKGFSGNPFRYAYPGVKNPNGYDLWVQIVTKPGTTNLVCNWSKATQINTTDP